MDDMSQKFFQQDSKRFIVETTRHGSFSTTLIRDTQTEDGYLLLGTICDLLNTQHEQIIALEAQVAAYKEKERAQYKPISEIFGENHSQQPPNEMSVCEGYYKPTASGFAMVDSMWLCPECLAHE